ncbi:CUBN, partial [Cervus elaphus hippelaphus]
MTAERGNLVFLTGSAQNIEFRTGSLGRIKLNDEDVGECFHQLVALERKFQSLQQTLDRKVCSSNPCQHGGTCLNLPDSFFCMCPSQWKGPLCSVDVNECEIYSGTPLGCQNGATCINTAGSY